MMNAYDGHLAHNIRKQEITKMRAVFRPLLKKGGFCFTIKAWRIYTSKFSSRLQLETPKL